MLYLTPNYEDSTSNHDNFAYKNENKKIRNMTCVPTCPLAGGGLKTVSQVLSSKFVFLGAVVPQQSNMAPSDALGATLLGLYCLQFTSHHLQAPTRNINS